MAGKEDVIVKYNFDEQIDRTSTVSIKWAREMRRKLYGSDSIIPMGIADMDLKTAPCISAAIRDRAQHETYGYGYASAEYLNACVDWQRRRHGRA